MDQLFKQAAAILKKVDHLVILSGAGASKESGIPTFREAQTGLWAQYDPQELATPQAYRRNPQLVWEWYQFRRGLVRESAPNAGHYALAELEKLIPKVVVLTQNIDGLHQAAGSSDIVELHGNILRSKCFAGCRGELTLIEVSQLPDREASPPSCPHCGDQVRPDVVWFGESLSTEALGRAYRVSAECDAMLVVGTSGVVYPAAGLPAVAKEANALIIEVNPSPSGITPLANIFLAGPGGSILPKLIELIAD